MIRTILAALLGSAALAAPAAAQQVPIVQAGAGGRYETSFDPKNRVPRFSPAQVAAFQSRMARVIDLFAAMPQVTSPPDPICHRLSSWVEITSPHQLLSGAVYMMSPISFENGRCHRMTGAGIEVRLNALSLLRDPQEAFVRANDAPSDWFLLPYSTATARVIRIGNTIGFTHGRAPLFQPVSAERYLRERLSHQPADPVGGSAGELARWLAGGKANMLAEHAAKVREMAAFLQPDVLAKMSAGLQAIVEDTERDLRRDAARVQPQSERQRLEAQLASMSTTARAAPACFPSAAGGLDFTPGCPTGFTLMELNPAYFDKNRPEAVQLLVVETPEGRTHGENDARLAARMAVWNALDHAKLAAIVE
jgi:hypothetical protein